MKTSIPSDVWEKKKSLIARLYKDEEWPLKQVIKQIRTEDFNPSETQLRSRLKKWRVTKPSRQTRKKPQENAQQETKAEDDDGPEDPSSGESKNASHPTPQPQSTQQLQPPKDVVANSEWYTANGWFPPQQRQQQDMMQPPAMAPSLSVDTRDAAAVGSNWVPSAPAPAPAPGPAPESQSQQSLNPRDNSNHIPNTTPAMQPFAMVAPTPISYDLRQPASSTSNMPMNTTPMVAPSYPNPGYAASTEVCLPSPAPPMGAQWPTGAAHIEPDVNAGFSVANWFSAPFEPANPQSATYYPHKAVNPSMAGYGQMIQPMSAQDMNQTFPQSPSVAGAFHSSPFDDFGYIKPWRRAMASHYGPEGANGHPRVDRQGRQRKPASERKQKDPPSPNGAEMAAHQSQMQSMQTPMQPQFVASGQHPMMPQEMFGYSGHDQLVQRPPGH